MLSVRRSLFLRCLLPACRLPPAKYDAPAHGRQIRLSNWNAAVSVLGSQWANHLEHLSTAGAIMGKSDYREDNTDACERINMEWNLNLYCHSSEISIAMTKARRRLPTRCVVCDRLGSRWSATATLLLLSVLLSSISLASSQTPTEQPAVSSPSTFHPAIPSPSPTIIVPTPSISPWPTHGPTLVATGTLTPINGSLVPSDIPSEMPSQTPTAEATFAVPSTGLSRFRQIFSVENGRIFTDPEIVLFQGLYRSYTVNFAPRDVVEERVDTACEVLFQEVLERRLANERRMGLGSRVRRMQTNTSVQVDYTMSYESVYTNVTAFPLLFQSYVNTNLEQVSQQMRLLGLNVSEVSIASRVVTRPDPTGQPTSTPTPTTLQPSISTFPSIIPSAIPSSSPTSSSLPPSTQPSLEPTSAPSPHPMNPSGASNGSETVIVVSVVVAVSILLIGLLVYYRKRKLVRELEFQANAVGHSRKKGLSSRENNSWGNSAQKHSLYELGLPPTSQNRASVFDRAGFSRKGGTARGPAGAMIEQSESLVSNQSLLSAGNSMGGDSGDEIDATHNLADEFDQYKDQNLEKMRADVEGSLTGFDGMMSQALTRALIDDDESNFDPGDLHWGGSGQLKGAEIEASVLGEVTDWLKRKESRSDEER